MTKKNSNDIIDLVTHFQRRVLENKPPVSLMFEEIRMMSFKIRPLNGDISLLDLKNKEFIEILWSLGKLDEFFQKQYKSITSKNKNLFLRLFDEIHDRYQEKLNTLNLKPEQFADTSSAFEMEIFKERTLKHN